MSSRARRFLAGGGLQPWASRSHPLPQGLRLAELRCGGGQTSLDTEMCFPWPVPSPPPAPLGPPRYQRKYSYQDVSRTLCQPQTKREVETQLFYVDVSTLSEGNASYRLQVSRVENFVLRWVDWRTGVGLPFRWNPGPAAEVVPRKEVGAGGEGRSSGGYGAHCGSGSFTQSQAS